MIGPFYLFPDVNSFSTSFHVCNLNTKVCLIYSDFTILYLHPVAMSFIIYGSSNVYRNFERARSEVIGSEKTLSLYNFQLVFLYK